MSSRILTARDGSIFPTEGHREVKTGPGQGTVSSQSRGAGNTGDSLEGQKEKREQVGVGAICFLPGL